MNKAVLFTGSRAAAGCFEAVERSRKWEFETLPVEMLRTTLKAAENGNLYLLDYESIAEVDRARDLGYFLKKQDIHRAVVDRKSAVADPAELLMKGCDYLGPAVLEAGIKPVRLNKYLDFFKCGPAVRVPATPEKNEQNSADSYICSPGGWKDIRSGKEYTFYMMFTEISIPSEWKKKSGNVHLNRLKQTFHNVAERTAAGNEGKIWIWNEYGGLILFPYTGSNCNAVMSGIKLMLNRVIISIEDFGLHTPIRLRTAMHLGTTTWKARGKTGTIISDSLNSIFHLGTKYTPLDDMDITEEIYGELPDGIRNMFSEAGRFEDRTIYRLCHFEVIS